MKPDFEFEQHLRRQPAREIPPEWRTRILSAASAERPGSLGFWQRGALRRELAKLLWPHPVAWAGLAAVWMFIIALNFSMREASPMVAKQRVQPSPETLVELKNQQRMFAELLGPAAVPDADRPKVLPPKPRSERMRLLAT
jgi:hypothetical protein